ncbi:hypothetical protein P5673_020545 [Acropora cervicornis]|uniref:Ubiquitin-like domain-containing protein n=1 Tax=Acropora cervicornis TaxID=6130 RepID=A0AAD9QA08_ACRCE|nr:hypothetical protein P5673_020545 [Acropora cervicornis]
MLIYVESRAFPRKTFTLVCNPHETIARARAQMLHILYELGRAEHQFRFRFKGEYLRDGYTFEDYRILDNSVIKMVPMSKRKRATYNTVFGNDGQDGGASEIHDFGSKAQLLGQEELDDVQKALRKEVAIFERREHLLGSFKVLLWIHFLATVLAFTTIYWFSAFWTGNSVKSALMLFGFLYSPNYTRLGGFVGKYGMNKNTFVIAFSVGGIMNVTASLLMGIYVLLEVFAYECDTEEATCLRQMELMYWSIILYGGQTVVLVGDLIETYLVQIRDIDKVMKSAKTGSVKERRNAAFELASLAATGDDTKFKIVQEGGEEMPATQEYAIEAISELLTVPVIQDQFVDLGGVRTMCALLHSKENRVVNEAVTALSYIVSDMQIPASRIVAAIFLELAFTAEIRVMLSRENAPASSLVHLCRLRDPETQRLSLQTLELLAIENSDVIIRHESLLELLLSLYKLTDDPQLFLLAGKIILYYAENELACQKLVESEDLKPCLMEFSYCMDPLLQNVVAKIILAMIESHENKDEIASLGLDEVLIQIKSESSDRDAWRTADHGLMILHNVKPLGKQTSQSSNKSSGSGEGLVTVLPIKKAL